MEEGTEGPENFVRMLRWKGQRSLDNIRRLPSGRRGAQADRAVIYATTIGRSCSTIESRRSAQVAIGALAGLVCYPRRRAASFTAGSLLDYCPRNRRLQGGSPVFPRSARTMLSRFRNSCYPSARSDGGFGYRGYLARTVGYRNSIELAADNEPRRGTDRNATAADGFMIS